MSTLSQIVPFCKVKVHNRIRGGIRQNLNRKKRNLESEGKRNQGWSNLPPPGGGELILSEGKPKKGIKNMRPSGPGSLVARGEKGGVGVF